MRRLAVLVAVLACAAPAAASEGRPTLSDIEDEVVCPTCQTTLDQSNAPIAERMRAYIRGRIAAGDTKSEIKAQLVAQFGDRVLAEPRTRGFDLVAWLLPLGGALVAAGLVGAALLRWSRAREPSGAGAPSSNGRPPLAPELERRVDEELARFDG